MNLKAQDQPYVKTAVAILLMFFLFPSLSHRSFAHSASNYANADNHIIVSPIGRQQVMVGGGINIFFTAFDPVIGGAAFYSDDLPAFAEIVNNGDNTGFISVNTSLGQEGAYLFHLTVDGSAGSTTIPIHLNVLGRIPGGTVYYCDPENGSMDNSGDSSNPWGSLEQVFSSNTTFEAGDIIFLRDGYHGRPEVLGKNDGNVFIAAQANHTPKVRSLRVVFAENWVISGLEISPESAGITEVGTYLRIVSNVENVTIENCHIYAIKNSGVWDENQDWYDNCGDGILNKGTFNTLRNNLLTNTYFTVTVDGSHNHFDYNIIDRFGGDAIRGIKGYNSFNYNTITNGVVADYDTGNHDDIFQSWTFGAPIKSIEIIGNIAFSCTDPDLPLKTNVLQGIVIFDGFAEDWIVENNLVITDHPHGISLYGAKNCKIVNNTVIRNPLELFFYGSHPWIRVNRHKDGSFSSGNLVRNNLSGAMILDAIPGTDDHNTVSTDYNLYFNDYDNWDFHLKADAATIDAGFWDDSPEVDHEHFVKLPNTIPDQGCFEREAVIFDVESPTPPDNVEALETTATSIVLSWDAASDNTGVSHYRVKYEDGVIATTDTEAYIYGLSDDHTYDFEVIALDYSGNTSTAALITITTETISSGQHLIYLAAHQDDQQIRSNNKLEWVGLYEHQLGGAGSNYDVAAVIPFRLPILETTERVKFAELRLNLKGIQNTPESGIDLYGLPARNISDVKTEDYWQGSYNSGDNGTGLIQDYITVSSNTGIIPLDTISAASIAEYINDQYEQGASTGDYIFLRLNSGATDEVADAFYTTSSANEPQSLNRPYLVLTIEGEPDATQETITALSELKIFPNPFGTKQYLMIEIPVLLSHRECLLTIHDFMGHLVYEEIIINPISKHRLNITKLNLTSGAYQLSLKGKSFIAKTKLIIN